MMSFVQAVVALFASPNLVDFPHEQEGQVLEVVVPGKIWRISYQASYWSARSHQSINFCLGDRVKVVERQGIVLFIEPLETGEKI